MPRINYRLWHAYWSRKNAEAKADARLRCVEYEVVWHHDAQCRAMNAQLLPASAEVIAENWRDEDAQYANEAVAMGY